MTYKLLLPDSASIHPVFHVSQLKEHIPDHTPVFSDLPPAVFFRDKSSGSRKHFGQAFGEKRFSCCYSNPDQVGRSSYGDGYLGGLQCATNQVSRFYHLGTSWFFRRGTVMASPAQEN
jgi:hypothetical protein